MYKIIPAAPLTSISMIGLIFRFRDKNNTPPKIATAPISSDSFIVFKSGSPVPKKESNMIVAAADTINPREAASLSSMKEDDNTCFYLPTSLLSVPIAGRKVPII